jgi:hypothetical protein
MRPLPCAAAAATDSASFASQAQGCIRVGIRADEVDGTQIRLPKELHQARPIADGEEKSRAPDCPDPGQVCRNPVERIRQLVTRSQRLRSHRGRWHASGTHHERSRRAGGVAAARTSGLGRAVSAGDLDLALTFDFHTAPCPARPGVAESRPSRSPARYPSLACTVVRTFLPRRTQPRSRDTRPTARAHRARRPA